MLMFGVVVVAVVLMIKRQAGGRPVVFIAIAIIVVVSFVVVMDVNAAAFRGVEIAADSARVGDIIQNNRGGTSNDFAFAKANANYPSHSAIVVARGEDHLGKFALTVGGNESNSIRRVRVQLNDDGSVRQRATNAYICILKNQK